MPNVIVNRRAVPGVGPEIVFNSLINGLKGFWPLNDSSANLQNGTIMALYSDASYAFSAPNTVIISAAGFAGLTPVADFHTNAGSDPSSVRRIQSSDAGLNFPANQQFTASIWVNLSAQTASNPLINNWGTSGFYLGQSGANLWTCGVHDNTNAGQFVSGAATSTGTWVFLAGGWDGANVWLQVNNGARSTLAVAATHSFSDNFSLGSYPGNTGSIPVNGYLAGAGLWFRTLALAEVSILWNGGAPESNPFTQ